jgi:hypothetical protein
MLSLSVGGSGWCEEGERMQGRWAMRAGWANVMKVADARRVRECKEGRREGPNAREGERMQWRWLMQGEWANARKVVDESRRRWLIQGWCANARRRGGVPMQGQVSECNEGGWCKESERKRKVVDERTWWRWLMQEGARMQGGSQCQGRGANTMKVADSRRVSECKEGGRWANVQGEWANARKVVDERTWWRWLM